MKKINHLIILIIIVALFFTQHPIKNTTGQTNSIHTKSTSESYNDNIVYNPIKQNPPINNKQRYQQFEKSIQSPNNNNKKNNFEDSWTFYPSDDTFIDKDFPNDIEGLLNHMIISALRDEYYWDRDVLIKFDISSLPSDIEVYAKLYLYFYHEENNPSGREYSIYRIDNDWDEDTAKWNNRPGYYDDPTDFLIIPESTGVWLEFDVTNDVQDFINEEQSNYGWLISDDDSYGDGEESYFYTKEHGNFIPYLVIKEPSTIYVDDDNTEGPWFGTYEYPYIKIQDGIDNCFSGDTIYVFNGTYNESVLIYKECINLIGESKLDTIIVNHEKHYTLLIRNTYYGITVNGFTIKSADENSNKYIGVGVDIFAHDNIISNNNINNNLIGVALWGGNQENKIINNHINNNDDLGIFLYHDCRSNTFSDNTIDNCSTCILSQYDCINNRYCNNIITNTETGFYLKEHVKENYIINNTFIKNKYGIYADHHVYELSISKNIFTENEVGIALIIVLNCNVSYNVIDKNICGIVAQDWGYWEQVNIYNNNITNNKGFKILRGGIFADELVNCDIFCNNFINNLPNAIFRDIPSIALGTWDRNYWDKPRVAPYPIFGRIGFTFIKIIPWVQFDWRPALLPYNIDM